MLEKRLKQIIPNLHRTFAKLKAGSPYYFLDWKKDRSGVECLYYWFWDKAHAYKNQKRIPITEIRAGLKELINRGIFDRSIYHKACKIAESDGPCGFAVMGRCYEYLGVASFIGVGKGFKLNNSQRAKTLAR